MQKCSASWNGSSTTVTWTDTISEATNMLSSIPAAITSGGDGVYYFCMNKGEDGKRVDDVEDGGIEHGLVAEDGGDDGIAHEADVAEHQREAHDALVLLLPRQIAGQQERHRRKHDVGDDADGEQRQDIAAVGQLARHRRREDERGTGDVDDQPRQLAVEVAA